MSIATELTLLANSKQAIKNSINQKGGSITDSTPFADYSTAIDNLPSGGGDNSAFIDLIEGDITTLNIPIGTTKVRNSAFQNCPNLTSVTLPTGLTRLENYSFYNLTALRTITFPNPNTVTYIGGQSFQKCTSLTNVVLPDSVTYIGGNTFDGCTSLTSINIPSGITSIGIQCFQNTGLTSITIPNNITSIENGAFANSKHFTKVIVERTTPPTLGFNAFYNTNDCPIYVPSASVEAYKAATNWSTYASRIYPITQLATVDGNPVYNYDLLNKDATTITDVELEKMPAGTSVEFAEGLTNITAGEINYQQVTLPSTFTGFGDSDMIGSSVTTITSNAVTPPSAFRNQLGGSGLTAIYVPASSVDAYKENATWSSFASIIQSIPAE